MANWTDRLKESIFLTSPSGIIFEASWSGNPRRISNKVGIHEFPGIPGARVQDLGCGAWSYPLTVFFTGENNDRDADEFAEAFKNEAGEWIINHPVKGNIFLIKIDAVEHIQPVTSGNITTFETNWIEPLPESDRESLAEIQNQAQGAANQALEDSAESFLDVLLDTAGQAQAMTSTVGSAITTVKKKLALVENFSILDPQILAIESAINNTLAGPIIDTTALAGQLQQYVRIFGLGQTSATDAIEMYSKFADEIVQNVPTQGNDEGLSKMSVTELMAGAAVASASEMALIGGVTSRAQLITTIDKLATMQDNITNALDAVQELYSDAFIDTRYYSQLETYKTSFMSTASSTKFLLQSLFGLPAERRIILKKDTFTPQVAKDEYGSVGDSTGELVNLDLLISSNGLMDNEIYIIPEGTEVLIYQ